VLNATVKLENTGHSTQVDENGSFQITGIFPGTYTLLVTADGMIPLRQELVDLQGSHYDIDLPKMTILTQQDLDQAVAEAIENWDIGADGLIGLSEAIRALQVVSDVRYD
jgi:hypothetical protein